MNPKYKNFFIILFSIFFVVLLFASRQGTLTNTNAQEQLKDIPLIDSHNQNSNFNIPEVAAPNAKLSKIFGAARPASVKIVAKVDNASLFNPNHQDSPDNPHDNLDSTIGIGTGFFISEDGLVLTAYHVVDITEFNFKPEFTKLIKFEAISPDNQSYPLELIAFDAILDLALLQAKTDHKVAKLNLATRSPRKGAEIVAIGNSRNDFLAARSGRVIQLGITGPKGRFADQTIELSAPLAAGDSGGPVLNTKGEVIGVTSYIAYNPGGLESNSPHVPRILKPFVDELPDYASFAINLAENPQTIINLKAGVNRDVPVIGFSSGPNLDYDPDFSSVYLGELPGAVVSTVAKNGPAEQAGLHSLQRDSAQGIITADVIVAIDDVKTPTMNDVIDLLFDKEVGDEVILTVQREAKTIKLKLVLGAKSKVFN